MWLRGGWLLVLAITVGCAGDPPRAPVEQRRGLDKALPSARPYTVQRGDTLYAIAWRYGIDYRELARLNRIPRPYTIYPGQVIALSASSAKSLHKGRKVTPATPPAAVPKPTESTGAAPAVAAVKPASGSPTRPVSVPANAPVKRWRWPTSGKVIRGFSGTVHKGVDIAGEAGDPVQSTAAGTVVYAGSGIVGYGQLVIVKHNQIYLSAYGHNRRLLVAEGEAVTAGQKIAEKGSSGTNAVKLHFEIRREGKPVDPQGLLPPR